MRWLLLLFTWLPALCQAQFSISGIGPPISLAASPVLVSHGANAHGNTVGTSLQVALNNAPINGNTVWITVFETTTVSVSSVKNQGSGATFTKVTAGSGSGTVRNYETWNWVASGAGNTNTYTITFSATTNISFAAGVELSGGSEVIDQIVYTEDVTGTALSTGTTGATSQANEFAYAFFGGPGPSLGVVTFSSPTNGFAILDGTSTEDTLDNAWCLQSKTLNSVGTVQTGVTASNNITASSAILITIR